MSLRSLIHSTPTENADILNNQYINSFHQCLQQRMSLVYSTPILWPSPCSIALNISVIVNGVEKFINSLNHTRPADQTRFPPVSEVHVMCPDSSTYYDNHLSGIVSMTIGDRPMWHHYSQSDFNQIAIIQ